MHLVSSYDSVPQMNNKSYFRGKTFDSTIKTKRQVEDYLTHHPWTCIVFVLDNC